MMRFLRLMPWLRLSFLVVALSLLSGGVWSQDEASQRSLAQAQEIRLQLQKLGGQLARLRQNSTQADLKLSVQVRGVQQQIEQLERKQADLIERLQTLQTHHEQNQADHRLHHQQLVKVLWGLAGLGGLMLLMLWRLRSPRALSSERVQPSTTQPRDSQPTATLPVTMQNKAALASVATQPLASSEPAASEPPPMTSAEAGEVGEQGVARVTTPSVVISPVGFTPPFVNATADLAVSVTDSSSTEQVLAKGLQGFMQPVQFK
ncbi:hypothetical protein [Limnohabitans sp. Rim8]|uniref:hypothetical protein n=1 Tax=Limnohabitans sp. Rim8 TaxID=1100718 RepID=UPI0026034C7C|nr:hypothetical protein [Limnohabitans sp. Rim8]